MTAVPAEGDPEADPCTREAATGGGRQRLEGRVCKTRNTRDPGAHQELGALSGPGGGVRPCPHPGLRLLASAQ